MPESFAKGVLSFLFYTSLVLTIQSVHLYLADVRLNPYLIWILAAISLVLWMVSGSKISHGAADKPLEPTSKKQIPTP